MGNLILNSSDRIVDSDLMNFSDISFGYKQILFNESKLKQIEYLKNILDKGYNIYFQLYSFYQDDLGVLNVPRWYKGRIIVSKKLSSLVLEFKYDERLLLEETQDFINSLFWTSGIYVSKMNSNEIQEFYYDYNSNLLKEYFENFVAMIEVDNDGSYMNITYSKKIKPNIFV